MAQARASFTSNLLAVLVTASSTRRKQAPSRRFRDTVPGVVKVPEQWRRGLVIKRTGARRAVTPASASAAGASSSPSPTSSPSLVHRSASTSARRRARRRRAVPRAGGPPGYRRAGGGGRGLGLGVQPRPPRRAARLRRCGPKPTAEWLAGWGPLERLAAPSFVSVCLEWLWYEVMILLCGLLPDPKPTVASMGVVMQTTALVYVFPSSLGLGVSKRVGNELGANRPARARASDHVAVAGAACMGLAAMSFAPSRQPQPTAPGVRLAARPAGIVDVGHAATDSVWSYYIFYELVLGTAGH
ncbi:hypothetical protein EJB05_03539, partial [Eragrostis curvula]